MNVWQGKRIKLRGIEPADAEEFFAWNKDSDMARFVDHVWFPVSLEFVKQWAQETATQGPKDDQFQWVIEDQAGNLVGTINTNNCDRRVGTFGYGIAIREPHKRKGYASEAILLLLRYFFEELRYQKVTAHIYSNNLPSIRLHEKLHFQLEGRLRRMVFTEGQYFDKLLYGMTVEEFHAIPNKDKQWQGNG